MQNAYIPNNYYYTSSFDEPQPTTFGNYGEFLENFYQYFISRDALSIDGQYPKTSMAHGLVGSGAVSLEAFNYDVNQYQWQHTPSNVEQTYQMPHQHAVPSMRHYDSSYIGYSSSPLENSQGELDVSNSLNLLHGNHMGTGMATFDIPANNVMQQFQELGYLPTFETNTSFAGDFAGHRVSPETIYPYTPSENIPELSSTVTTPTSTSFPNTPPFVAFQTLYIPPAVPQPPPKKKRSHKKKKDTNLPPPHTTKTTTRRRWTKGPSAIKSQAWLDEYFSKDGICQLCGGGCLEGRVDRLLEHLVSVHFIQVIKNTYQFDEQHLAEEEAPQKHFITSEAAYDYTRRFVNAIRCSLCSSDTSLVFRSHSTRKHLRRVHRELDKATQNQEEERLKRLVPEREDFYNLHDKFLFYFPG